MAQSSYQQINLTSNITLSWPFSFQEGPTIADINNVNANSGNFKITLPDATLVSAGQNILFNNISANAFRVMNNDGVTEITTILAGEIYYLYLSNASTPNGVWTPIPFGSGTSAINLIEAETTGKTLAITNGTLTPPGGIITFETTDSISNLISNVKAPGLLVLKSLNPSTYETRTLLGGGNISITNGDGVNAAPIFSLATSLGGIDSIVVGDLQLSGKTITTTASNGGIVIKGIGTGVVTINGLQIDSNANITGANNLTLNGTLTVTGAFSSPTAPKVIFNFTDTSVPAGNTVTLLNQYNVDSVIGSNGTYTITFTNALTSGGVPSSNYAVNFGLGSNGGTPDASHVYWTLKTPTTLTIAIIDAGGVLVPNVPYGVSGTIYLPT